MSRNSKHMENYEIYVFHCLALFSIVAQRLLCFCVFLCLLRYLTHERGETQNNTVSHKNIEYRCIVVFTVFTVFACPGAPAHRLCKTLRKAYETQTIAKTTHFTVCELFTSLPLVYEAYWDMLSTIRKTITHLCKRVPKL